MIYPYDSAIWIYAVLLCVVDFELAKWQWKCAGNIWTDKGFWRWKLLCCWVLLTEGADDLLFLHVWTWDSLPTALPRSPKHWSNCWWFRLWSLCARWITKCFHWRICSCRHDVSSLQVYSVELYWMKFVEQEDIISYFQEEWQNIVRGYVESSWANGLFA